MRKGIAKDYGKPTPMPARNFASDAWRTVFGNNRSFFFFCSESRPSSTNCA